MGRNNEFSSKLGLIAAAVGSSIGLGNVWRFPAETEANGGAAFLLVYLLCVFILGIPVMLAEFSLGRNGRSDAYGVFNNLKTSGAWKAVGATAIIASFLILGFYMVVSGWTLEYLCQSITGTLYNKTGTPSSSFFVDNMQLSLFSGYKASIYTIILIIINGIILSAGIQKGIERLSKLLMPILFILLLTLCGVSMSLPNASEGIKFFLMPDFSKITPAVFVNALGQAFFSLSLGMGILITYASYFPSNTKLKQTAFIVSTLDLLMAILVGFIIFPAIKSFGLDGESFEGETLVFVTLPEVFAKMPISGLWSSIFFALLLVAALTSTVSIAEVTVSFLQRTLKFQRRKACWTTMTALIPISLICSLSFGKLNWLTFCGLNFFQLLDFFATNILLPLVSIGVCIYVGWFAPKNLLQTELSINKNITTISTKIIISIIKYIAPALVVIILIANII
jgi:NSS family neurotransmitter:Na+ symporter